MRTLSLFLTFLLLILISSGICIAQISVRVAETYKASEAFKKIYVSIEDHTVWAISSAGKVYYKKAADVDFVIYPPMSSAVVSDLAGFNESEMYFLEAPMQVTSIKDGISRFISLPFAGITRVNNIAVIYQKKLNAVVNKEDLLAIATNIDMYTVARGQTAEINTYPYVNAPVTAERDWRITHSGYHTVDFRYKYPSGGRCFDADYVNLNQMGGTTYMSVIPDKGSYPAKINATLFGYQVMDPPSQGGGRYTINFWGTDNGLYVKNSQECFGATVRNFLPGIAVNGLESVQSLTTLYKQDFVFAATNTGVYYTPASVFNEIPIGYPALSTMSLVAVPGTTGQKVNSLSADIYEFGRNVGGNSELLYPVECTKILWTASETGISRLEVTVDTQYYKNHPFVITGLYNTAIVGNQVIPTSEIIPGQNLNMNIRLLEHWGQLLIQWFRNGTEVPEWQGKRSVVLTQRGQYHVKVTTVCENLTISTAPITVEERGAPIITFSYPPEITLCENQTQSLSTLSRADYSYRWFKDNVQIAGASASYTVTVPGRYRVEVSNTPGVYVSSAEVQVRQVTLAKPVIIPGKALYCEDETAVLSVGNPDGFKTQWFFNGSELTVEANKNLISATKAGQYTVTVENAEGCRKSSDNFALAFAALPAFSILCDKASLCYGETATLSASVAATAYRWSTGETTPTIRVKNAGTYSLELVNAAGCKKTAALDISVLPEVVLSEPAEVKICTVAGESTRLTADAGFKSYSWNGIKGSAHLDVSVAGDYVLEVENDFGCKASTIYRVVSSCSEVIILNTFSPNNDGINDRWKIGGIENDASAELIIYNRYGNVVYRATGCCLSWDGTSNNNSLPVGTYFYTLETKQKASVLRGSITIIR